jgi:hypothetical protein
MLKRFTVFFILYFILINNLPAQRSRISFERNSIEQRLSQSTISYIGQDNIRLFWFGTSDGSNRYGGLSFKALKHDSNILNTVSHNRISFVQETEIEFGKIKNNEGIVFLTKDNVIGFEIKHANHLFEPFQRQNNKYKGPGTGLSIVHRIINRHGRQIWIKGTINEGATFYFTLK